MRECDTVVYYVCWNETISSDSTYDLNSFARVKFLVIGEIVSSNVNVTAVSIVPVKLKHVHHQAHIKRKRRTDAKQSNTFHLKSIQFIVHHLRTLVKDKRGDKFTCEVNNSPVYFIV